MPLQYDLPDRFEKRMMHTIGCVDPQRAARTDHHTDRHAQMFSDLVDEHHVRGCHGARRYAKVRRIRT